MSAQSQRGPETTTDDVIAGIDLTGCTAVVTGASSGIGTETARALASAGAHVILAVRTESAGQDAAAAIRGRHPGASTEVVTLDLTNLAAVRASAAEVAARVGTLDLLVNNAGVMATPFEHTADGFELQFGTNHLGHFLFTNLLRPQLDAAPAPRVVNLTSAGHATSDIIWDDPNFRTRPYDKWDAYGQSKTANILFTKALEQRLADTGRGHAYAVHPGMIATNLSRHLLPGDLKALFRRAAERVAAANPTPSATPAAPPTMKSVEQGAATTVWAATDPALAEHGGAYLEDCRVSRPSPWADDLNAAERLWAMSEGFVGQSFG